jgi:hypothetical protein
VSQLAREIPSSAGASRPKATRPQLIVTPPARSIR